MFLFMFWKILGQKKLKTSIERKKNVSQAEWMRDPGTIFKSSENYERSTLAQYLENNLNPLERFSIECLKWSGNYFGLILVFILRYEIQGWEVWV